MIAGVCDGIARYFDIDVVAVRLVFLLLLLFIGGGFLLYLILWIVMKNPDSQSNEPTYRN
ncbi:MAG: PspC domain-containing protein [Bacteroidales bacterium]|nr:PspC domain-containing protein [Bacteroidales bacterium]